MRPLVKTKIDARRNTAKVLKGLNYNDHSFRYYFDEQISRFAYCDTLYYKDIGVNDKRLEEFCIRSLFIAPRMLDQISHENML